MLTVRDHMALEIEDRPWPRNAIGRKDQAIITTLGMTPIQHARLVGALLERGDAEAAYPALVHRLRRLRDLRRERRGGLRSAS